MMPGVVTALSDFERRLFTERRIRSVAGVLFAANVVLLAGALLHGESAVAPNGGAGSIDFSCFYLGGAAAVAGHPASVYDYSAFAAAQAALFGSPQGGLPYFHFLYPPIFLLLTYPLALAPFFVAFAAWLGCTFLLYEAAAYAILPRASTLLAGAVPVAVLKNAQLGQNGFLTAGLVGLALVSLERRPVLAGVFIGFLAYKPQFGVLFPLALIAARQWRALASAAATTFGLAVIAGLIFGQHVWLSYIASLRGYDASLSPGQGLVSICQSVFGWLQWSGAAAGVALTAHLVAAVLVAAVVCAIWCTRAEYPLKAAVLCIGVVAATPHVLVYDLCILTMAVAFLVRDGLRRGFRPGERSVLLLCLVASSLLMRPFGPALYAALLGVAIWRLLADRARLRKPSLTAAAF